MTVQEVFDMAIHLMDEQNESTGATVTVDTKEYKFRTISILNTAIPVLYKYSSDYDRYGDQNTVLLLHEDYQNPDMEQGIPLDDSLCASLLPLYLSAQLLAAENESLSAWFLSRYQVVFQDIRTKTARSFEPISTPYGLF